MNELIALDGIDFALTLGMIGAAIALSFWQRLGLSSRLLIVAGRSLLQLLVVGYVLDIIFAVDTAWAVLAILVTAITIAAIVARNRISKKLNFLVLVWGSLFVSSALTLSYVILLIIQPSPWYEPQYWIPLAGMIFGNATTGASLAGERLISLIYNHRLEIETRLCLGASPQQAIAHLRQEAITVSLIPTFNQMAIAGLVSLPGMFTGQILAGSEPLNAASYQILILFAIALTNLIATSLITQGIYRQFFNQQAQLILP